MNRVGVLAICYGSRGTAIIDALCRSVKYSVELYIIDKNRNPFNVKKAKKHLVIPDLDVKKISNSLKNIRIRSILG